MQYREDKHGNRLSILGYGCMRFTSHGGKIDVKKAEKEIMEAYQSGVNYFDTAYLYPGSEETLGTILQRNKIREKVNIATKLPQYMINNSKLIDKYFNEELIRLKTDYIDYYLMHSLTDYAQWEKLKSFGIIEWIKNKKENGQIRNIGFSYHGGPEMFIKILHDYDWDFAQIQYNYLDEYSQAGRSGLEEAKKLNIPLIIMEPLRGGTLANKLPDSVKKMMKNNVRHYSPVKWSFLWLFNQKGINVVLSGMNSLEMVKENCAIADYSKLNSFSDEDREFIKEVAKEIKKSQKVGCTGCRYCMPCVKGIDIPCLFSAYNRMYYESKMAGRVEFGMVYILRKDAAFADACIKCGKCESHCPQKINIREEIIKADKALRPLHIKVAIKILRFFMLRGTNKY